jgi:hypothetical protein
MATVKSSAENLTLNADGANNDIKFQSNGVEKASIDQDGKITAGGASLDGAVVFNESGADVDFRVESDGDANAFFVQGQYGFVGLGQGTPRKMLQITEPSSDCVIILDSNNTSSDKQICFANHYGTGNETGGNYWGIGIDDSANQMKIGFDANSQASMGGADDLVKITSDGDVTVSTGDLIFGTAGKGVCLGVTSNTDANTLDDYEEGTWTPTLTCSTSGSYTLDSGSNLLAYTKVGRVVHCQGYISINGESSPDGNLRLSLPFTTLNGTDDIDYAFGTGIIQNHGGSIPNGITMFVPNNSAYVNFYTIADNGTASYINESAVDTNFQIGIGFSYIAA